MRPTRSSGGQSLTEDMMPLGELRRIPNIYYVEAGEGEPLLVVNNAMVSTNPIRAHLPFAYASSMGTFAEHFRVIAHDT